MAISIAAVFEKGVFRPLVPVDFDEGMPAEVTVHVAPVAERPFERILLPAFAAMRPIGGDSTQQISEDRDRES
jgi:predicted DNA-binding antitoxin AbrB/MazE fold protein